MNKILYMALCAILVFTSCKDEENPKPIDNDGYDSTIVSLGAGQIYDVFYKLSSGDVIKLERSNWDLAFSTNPQSATVRINDAAGIKLFCAGAMEDWDNISADLATEENQLYNSASDWMEGAFNANIDTSDWTSVGWGTYNFMTHTVMGDSIFILEYSDQSKVKFAIEKRDGTTHGYHIKWSAIDGGTLETATIDPDAHTNQLFVYYSLSNKALEPTSTPSTDWDLKFSTYTELVPFGPGTFAHYPVTGVLTNPASKTAVVSEVPVEDAKVSDSEDGYSSKANAIGYNWKKSNHSAGTYTIVEDLSYFVLDADSVLYQIYFTNYTGIPDGDISFKTKKVEE